MTSTHDRPIHRANVYELVAERLIADISEHRLAPGEQLPTERELTERFGVGRSSVREALRKLESYGIIHAHGKGQFVIGSEAEVMVPAVIMLLSLGHASLGEVHELRRILEVNMAPLAARRRQSEDLNAMRRANRAMRASMPAPQATMAADLDFHAAIAAASHNRAIAATATALWTALQRAQQTYHVSEQAIAQHDRIIEAIAASDPKAARLRAAEHVDWIESVYDSEPAGGDAPSTS
jgi:DNA-binding FadR family transcriptional regulator